MIRIFVYERIRSQHFYKKMKRKLKLKDMTFLLLYERIRSQNFYPFVITFNICGKSMKQVQYPSVPIFLAPPSFIFLFFHSQELNASQLEMKY